MGVRRRSRESGRKWVTDEIVDDDEVDLLGSHE